MVLFVTALTCEADPVIQRYRLKKDMALSAFPVYRGKNKLLIISGVGRLKAAMAVAFILGHERLPLSDLLLVNLGFFGSDDPAFATGDLVLAGRVSDQARARDFYPDLMHRQPLPVIHLRCVDQLKTRAASEITPPMGLLPVGYDMESAGFLEAALRFVGPDQVLVLKMLSDHLTGEPCDLPALRSRLASHLPQLEDLVDGMKKTPRALTDPTYHLDRQGVASLAEHLRLTTSQQQQLFVLARRHRLAGGNPLPALAAARQHAAKQSPQQRSQQLEHFKTIWFNDRPFSGHLS